MKNANLVSTRKFAEMMEVSQTAVRKWIDKGIIESDAFTRRGDSLFIDAKKGKAQVEKNRDAKKRMTYEALPEGHTNPDRHKSHPGEKGLSRQRLEENAGKTLDYDMSTEHLSKLSYNDLIKLQAMKTAQLKHIEVLEAEGKLVSKEMVHRKLFEYGKLARESVLGVIERVIDRIMIAKTRDEVAFILKSEYVQALEILTKPVENAGI